MSDTTAQPATVATRPFGRAFTDKHRLYIAKHLVIDQLRSLEWQHDLALSLHTVQNGESLHDVSNVKPEDCPKCWAIAAATLAKFIEL